MEKRSELQLGMDLDLMKEKWLEKRLVESGSQSENDLENLSEIETVKKKVKKKERQTGKSRVTTMVTSTEIELVMNSERLSETKKDFPKEWKWVMKMEIPMELQWE